MNKKKKKKTARIKQCAPDRAQAAAEVLEAVWLSDFELECMVDHKDVVEDASGNPWVAVRIQVPQLDVDMWLAGEHVDQQDGEVDS